MQRLFFLFFPLFIVLSLLGCRHKEAIRVSHYDFDGFVPRYNASIARWITEQKIELEKQINELEKEEDAPQKKEEIKELKRAYQRFVFREQCGDFFAFYKEEDIPNDLVWQDGLDEPEIGDSRAKKGGVFRSFIMQFPATVRPFGKESNNSFRGRLYDEISIGLTGLHPVTRRAIPGIANQWAVSKDGRTVFFKIDPQARYSDGVSVRAIDGMVGIYVRVSDAIAAPFEKQYYREQFAQIALYGQNCLAVTLPEPKPLMTLYAQVPFSPPHFYKHYGPDYVNTYQWKVEPTTGAYFVKDKDIVKGVSITLTRVKDWWAKDRKYYRYCYNPDKIVYMTIRDESKAFELFRAGQLDTFYISRPDYWYEKSEIPPVFKGYIQRYKFYTQYPRVPRGIYLNLAKPLLKDLSLRKGIAFALHWKKVIDVAFRGDYSRLEQFSMGFGEFTNPSVKARPFSVVSARKNFEQAGFTVEGKDGILQKPDGTRLAISLSYPNVSNYSKIVSILKEDARKAGLDLQLDGQESTVFYKKVMQKEHEMCFWGWGVTPPFPRYYQFFHSQNAFDTKGNPKAQTNNITSYANGDMDMWTQGVRNARSEEELKKNAWAIQQKIHDEALFSPAWVSDFVCIASWRWVRWPDTPTTRFNVPTIYDPLESYVLWIDESIKKDTLEAMRSGRTFPEVQKIIDTYKKGIAPEKNHPLTPQQ